MMNNDLFQFEVKRADNFCFQTGFLAAALQYSIPIGLAPGVKIVDREAFEAWAKNEVAKAKDEADRLYPRG